MSFQSLLQQDGEDQRWAGNGWVNSHGSHSLRGGVGEQENLDVDGGVSRNGGGGGGVVHREEFSSALALNTSGGSGAGSGVGSGNYGAELALFSPSELFSPARQQVSSPFNWQSLLGGHPSGARWQADTPFAVAFGSESGIEQASSLNAYRSQAESNVKRVGGSDAVQNDVCQAAHESSASDGVISEVEVDPSSEVKDEWTTNVNAEKENWRKFGGQYIWFQNYLAVLGARLVENDDDFMVGDVKQEFESIQEAGYILGDGIKSRKRHTLSRPQGHPEVIVNFEHSASSSDSDSDSEESGRLKRESLSRKRKKPGQDPDGNVTWTDESVQFLFETYDAIHQRLWEESKGQVKYQKKWTPILKAMQTRFGNHFTKKQCQSKYWSVRRECTEYRIMSTKAAATDPMWNPSIAGRELLKPKFYDVWLEVSGKNQAIVMKTKPCTVKGDVSPGELLKGEPSTVLGKDGQPVKQRMKDFGNAIKEMQRLMIVELQASEKREEAMKYRAELMMELLTQHIEHVENRVNTIDESRNPQLHLLERVNLKLEKVLDGFTALNQHLSKLHRG